MSARIKFLAYPTKATAGPPIGPILGQQGIPIMDFCKSFNEESKIYNTDLPVSVSMTISKDKTFTYTIKSPSTMFLIQYYMKHYNTNTISRYWIYEISKIKKFDNNLKDFDLKSIYKMVLSTAKSMKLKIH